MSRLPRLTLIGLSILLIALVAFAWLGTPALARYGLEQYFARHGAQFSADDVQVHPLRSMLEFRNLAVVQNGETRLRGDVLAVRFNLPDLLDRRVHISRLEGQNLTLDVVKTADAWQIAGIDIDSSSNNGTDHWPVELDDVDVQASQIRVLTDLQQDRLNLRRLQVRDLDWQPQRLRGRIELLGDLNEAPLSLQADLLGQDGQFETIAEMTVTELPLERLSPWLPASWLGSSGRLNFSGNLYLDGDAQSWLVEFANANLELRDAHLLHAPFTFDSEQLTLALPQLDMRWTRDAPLQAIGSLRLETAGSKLFHRSDQRLLAQWSGLVTQSASLDLDEETQFRLPGLELTELTFSHRLSPDAPLPALLHAKQARLENLEQQGWHTQIGLIALRDADTNLVLSPERDPLNILVLDDLLASAEPTPPDTPASEETSADTAPAADTEAEATPVAEPSFSLQRLDIAGTNTLTLFDRGVQPPYVRTLVVESFHIDRLDSRQPEQPSPFALRGSADGFARFHVDGNLYPLAASTHLDLLATVREADLPALSPYLHNHLNYEFRTGLLDLDLNLKIEAGQLDGRAHAILRGADLKPLDPARQKPANSTLIPLNVALSMIEDDQGNAELEIPLGGSANRTDFSLHGYLARKLGTAILQEASSYALQVLLPYTSVISIAELAREQMLKLEFKPLVLPPGGVPDARDAEFLRQFQEVMQKREDLRVTICGVATPADLNLPSDQRDLSEEQNQALHQLANRRALEFKKLAVASGAVASSRLLTCNAGVDFSDNAKPRVELDL